MWSITFKRSKTLSERIPVQRLGRLLFQYFTLWFNVASNPKIAIHCTKTVLLQFIVSVFKAETRVLTVIRGEP